MGTLSDRVGFLRPRVAWLTRYDSLRLRRVLGVIPAGGVLFGAVLLAHVGLVAWSAYRHSPVVSEVGHLPAAIRHWRLGEFDLYRVNPPLPRLIAAIPVLFAQPATDWKNCSKTPTIRRETWVGTDFVECNGQRIFFLFTLARWACIPFSVLGAWTCYQFARELYGAGAGIIAAVLWCFCPNILGNAALVTPDVPAAALAVTTCYEFWRWIRQPTWRRAFVVGGVWGLAELTKFTLIVFYVAFPLVMMIYRSRAVEGSVMPVHRRLGMFAVMVLISLYVINLGYMFAGTCLRVDQYQFQSRLLSGIEKNDEYSFTGNRFAGTWMSSFPIPLPKDFVQGLDLQRLDFERGMRSYLNGEWSDRGWWYFYFYGLSLKVPLGTWLLILGGLFLTLKQMYCRASIKNDLVLILPMLGIMTLVSSCTGFSIHFRYILPALPLLFVIASKSALMASKTHWVGASFVLLAVAWSVQSSVKVYPHSLSYFNEYVGPSRGHEYMLDSSISWGQDLLFLKEWYNANPEARPLQLAAFGNVDPRLAGIEFCLPPLGPTCLGITGSEVTGLDVAGKPDTAALGPKAGWFAIDVNYLHGSHRSAADGAGGRDTLSKGDLDLSYFKHFQPVARVGYSIYIFHISTAAANEVRKSLDLPALSDRSAGLDEGLSKWMH